MAIAQGCLRLFRAPWSESIDPRLPFEVRVHPLERVAEADLAWKDRLEPADAADLLARRAIVPLCDEGLLERVLRNAQRIAAEARIVERGITRYADALRPHSHVSIAPAHAPLAALDG